MKDHVKKETDTLREYPHHLVNWNGVIIQSYFNLVGRC